MRLALVCLWLLIPAVVAAYHYGPGQKRLVLDEVDSEVRLAEQSVARQDWTHAIDYYNAALAKLPGDDVAHHRQIRLERAKAQLQAGQLPEAYDDLKLLTDELADDDAAPVDLVSDARSTMASAHYYLTWLMRLEGRPQTDWEPEIEAARQNYRLLAEQAEALHDETAAQASSEDLESAIRLARMDLSELQALPLPSQCKNCNSGNCKNCKSKCKKPGQKPSEKKDDARSAGDGPPPDGRGS